MWVSIVGVGDRQGRAGRGRQESGLGQDRHEQDTRRRIWPAEERGRWCMWWGTAELMKDGTMVQVDMYHSPPYPNEPQAELEPEQARLLQGVSASCRRRAGWRQGGHLGAGPASGFPQPVAMDHRRDGACAAIVGSLMPLLGLRLKGMRRWRRQSCSGSEEEAGSLVAGWEDARWVTLKDRRRCANRPQAGYGRGTVSGCGPGVWRQESWLELVSFASRLPWIAQF